MWILVVGPEGAAQRKDGCVALLRELGAEIRIVGYFEDVDLRLIVEEPPSVVVVETGDSLTIALKAIEQLRSRDELRGVALILALSLAQLAQLDPAEDVDEIIVTPLLPTELLYRIRRAERKRADFMTEEEIKVGDLSLCPETEQVKERGRGVALTQQEFALLRFLLENRGRIFSRQQLLERVWGADYGGGERTVDVHVRRLRMKLGATMKTLETVRGHGYRMRGL